MDIHEIRKKHLLDLRESELRIRCKYDEDYIKILERKILTLEKKLKKYNEERDNELWLWVLYIIYYIFFYV